MKKTIRFFLFVLVAFQLSVFSAEFNSPQHNSKTVLLTGGAGFIGSNFLQYLFDKYPEYNFIVLDALTYAGSLENIPPYIRESNRFQFVKGSVTNLQLVDQLMASSHFVVHFAAETHVAKSIIDDNAFIDTDVLGTRTMMVALVKHAKTVERFIHISTSEVYGTAEYTPMDEEHPLKPKSPYAAAKAGADRLVYAYWCTYDIPAVIIRPFNNYGPKQHLEKMIPRFITAAILKEPLTVHGNGEQCRDWINTYDLSVALDKVLHIADFSKIKNQEINIGSGKSLSVLEIAKMILKEFQLPEEYLVFVGDRPGQVELHVSSFHKANSLLGWTPSIKFEEGIKKTIEWYVNNPHFWEKMNDDTHAHVLAKKNGTEFP